MKRILLIISSLAVLIGSVGCDMDLRPAGTVDPNNAIETITDAENFREGMYVLMRSTVGGTYASVDEIRSDLFHATSSFNNNGGTMYNWIQVSSDGDASTLWANSYYVIGDVNYFLQKISQLDLSEWSQESIDSLNTWKGEAYFIRAYHHMELAEKFCLSYVGNEQSFGIPYITTYSPSSNPSSYPSRGTLENTFSNILKDLDSAASYLESVPGVRGSERITADAVTALQARVALEMGDYTLAAEKAGELVNSGRYPLVSGEDAFKSMWLNDSDDESILQLYADRNELGASYDYTYLGYSTEKEVFQPYYVPEQWVIDLYDPDDYRFRNLFMQDSLQVAGGLSVTDVYMFSKFQGNAALRTGVAWNYQIEPKVFRIAEMYLICAEAAAQGGGGDPLEYINQLRASRNADVVTSVPGDVLDLILEERVRELIGEGFRIQDLKRLHRSLKRGAAQDESIIYQPSLNQDAFQRDYTDPRMLYPIPQAEIDANPQIAGQQNEGYN